MEATNPQAEVTETIPQAEVSIEDRILNAMGEGDSEEAEQAEEPAEETQEEEAAPEDELVEVEIDGELWQVPSKLKDGILMKQDYTRKTQEVAAERQAIQEQRQQVEQERQAFQNQVMAQQQTFETHAKISAIDQQIAQFTNVDWQHLYDDDPVTALKLDRSLRELKETRSSLVQNAIEQQQQIQSQQYEHFQNLVKTGKEELKKRIPDWSDDKAKELVQYGKVQGYTDSELGNLVDPRIVETLHKAYLYDKLVASKPEITKRVSNAPKIVKSGAQPVQKSNADVLRKIVKTSTGKAKQDALERLIATKL